MTVAVDSTIDELALDIVCVERVPMRLRRQDRIEAIRRLSAKGLSTGEIGRLVKTSGPNVGKLQKFYNIQPAPLRWAWWGGLSEENRNRATARQRRNRAARNAASR